MECTVGKSSVYQHDIGYTHSEVQVCLYSRKLSLQKHPASLLRNRRNEEERIAIDLLF
jgi:hypothetical protein